MNPSPNDSSPDRAVSRRRVVVALWAWSALAACSSSPVYFRPGENPDAQAPGGFPAVSYRVMRAGEQVGRVTVWSPGASSDDDGRTVIGVGFEIENWSAKPVVLDLAETDLRAVLVSGRMHERLASSQVDGGPQLASQDVGIVYFWSRLPKEWDAAPADVESFHVRWLLTGGEVDDLRHLTPFRQELRYRAGAYYSPSYYWGPGSGPYWGPWPYYPYPYWRGWYW